MFSSGIGRRGGAGAGPAFAALPALAVLAVLASVCTRVSVSALGVSATATGHALTHDDPIKKNNSVQFNVVEMLNRIDGIGKFEDVIPDKNDGSGPVWPSVTRSPDGASGSSGKSDSRGTSDSSVTSGSLIERFPWSASYSGVCGATILSATWLLTAAHCSLSTQGLGVVTVGTLDSRAAPGQRVSVKRAIVHPRFTVGPYWLNAAAFNISQVGARWDYMLLELARPLKLGGLRARAVSLLPLAARPDRPAPSAPPAPLYAHFLGLGADVHGGYTRPDFQLKQFEVLAPAQCEEMAEFVAEEMMCLRGGLPPHNSYACNGDSGSGAAVDGRLAGVVSWVENDARDCDPRRKLVLMRVDLARPWIRQHTGL